MTTTVCVDVTTSTTSSCTSTASTSGNFYILNSNSISGYNIKSGTLTALSGGPLTLPSGVTPWAMAVDPTGSFLYVSTNGGILFYNIGTGGKLTKVGSSVSLAGVAPVAMTIAPNGKFLLVSTSSSGVFAYPITNGAVGSTGVQVTQDLASSIQVDTTSSWLVEAVPLVGSVVGVTLNAVPINSTTGAYTQAAIHSLSLTVPNASLPNGQLAISGDDQNVFVALETGGTVVVPFNSANADPLPSTAASAILIGVAHTGGSALSVAVDPGTTPRLFYIGETLGVGNSGGLRAFTYASLSTPSSLVQASGSPIASGGLAPSLILPVATPDFVYVADGSGNINGFAITAASGPVYTISTGSTVLAGSQPQGMAEDSTGSYLMEVGSSGSPYFDAYTFDSATPGQLDSKVTSTAAATSIAIVAAP